MKAVGAWYRKVLGIEPNYDTEYYVGFTVGGDELGFHPPKEGARPAAGPLPQTAYWTVADIKAAVAHFVEHGAAESEAPHEVGGGIWVGSVRDPFGNVLGLIQNPRSPNLR